MAPGYRTQNRRQNRTGYADHDVFEGLPVRHWRRDYVMVAPPTAPENSASQNDIWAVELPHGMPKDSHLLPQHSQDLLRAARSGRIYKRPAPAEEEEVDPEAGTGDKPDKKEDDGKDRGFTAKAWKLIPRHLEGPDEEPLAKRRKGLVTYVPKPPQAEPTLTKATVRRTDAAGNEYIQDVVVPHGQQIDGEVIAQTIVPDPNAVATVDPYAATPASKKKSSSKKKSKSSKHRKRKSAAPTSVPQAIQIDAQGSSVATTSENAGEEGIKTEAGTGVNQDPAGTQDVEMVDGSNAASDDDDGEDGEDGEGGDEGDEDEGSVETQNSPSKIAKSSSPISQSTPSINDIPELSPPPAVGAAGLPFASRLEREKSEGKSGSPLKIVALATSTAASPITSPTTSAPPPVSEPLPPPQVDTAEVPIPVSTEVPITVSTEVPIPLSTEIPMPDVPALDEEIKEQFSAADLAEIPPPPPEPTLAEEEAAVEVRKEEEEEEGMLLDIVENANNSNIGAEATAVPEAPGPPPAIDPPVDVPETVKETFEETIVEAVVENIAEPEPVGGPRPETAVEPKTEAAVEDDDFPDLLGGLEKSLNQPPAPAIEVEAATVDISEVNKPADAAEAPEVPAPTEEPAAPAATEAPPSEETPAADETPVPANEANQATEEPPAATEG